MVRSAQDRAKGRKWGNASGNSRKSTVCCAELERLRNFYVVDYSGHRARHKDMVGRDGIWHEQVLHGGVGKMHHRRHTKKIWCRI